MKKICFLSFLASLASLDGFAQQTLPGKLNDTAWIQLMDSPKANYFVAVQNFEAYWANKQKRIREKEHFNDSEEVIAAKKRIRANASPEPPFINCHHKKKIISTVPQN